MERVYKSIKVGYDLNQHAAKMAAALRDIVEIETINRKGIFSYVLNTYFKDEETKVAWEEAFFLKV
jgi:hypothetical protein